MCLGRRCDSGVGILKVDIHLARRLKDLWNAKNWKPEILVCLTGRRKRHVA